MNPIQKALDEVQFRIPPPILNLAFRPDTPTRSEASLEHAIRGAVLEPRVMVDLNLQGGSTVFLDLNTSKVTVDQVDPHAYVYHVPDEVTQNRPIVQIYSIHFGYLGYQRFGGVMYGGQSTMSHEVQRVLDSALKEPPPSTSYLNLIGHNTFMVRFTYVPMRSAFIRCRLGHDEAMSEIRPSTFPDFASLCVLAVKAYIYNKMMVEMGQGQLSGGQTLGEIRETISNYADADEMYRQALVRWRKISTFNDPEAHHRALRQQIVV